MDIVQIKQIRKSIRQNNFDKKLFLGFVTRLHRYIFFKFTDSDFT
eukprot:SAG22_NODE_10689_length_520_cov_2.812352_1_plen_44_part_10